MATRFEFLIAGSDARFLHDCLSEAAAEILRIEARLSAYVSDSLTSLCNRDANRRPVLVDPEFFAFLTECQTLWRRTEGRFDPARGQSFAARKAGAPTPASADRVSFADIELDFPRSLVRFHHPSVQLDFGAVGKGYALDQIAERLRDHGIDSAFLHAGTSSILAWGHDHQDRPWRVALTHPKTAATLAYCSLDGLSLGVSAHHGHRNPRGESHLVGPTSDESYLLAAVQHPRALWSDALSTAAILTPPSAPLDPSRPNPPIPTLLVPPSGPVEFTPPNAWRMNSPVVSHRSTPHGLPSAGP